MRLYYVDDRNDERAGEVARPSAYQLPEDVEPPEHWGCLVTEEPPQN